MENKNLLTQIKETAKQALTTSLTAKGKAGEFNKLGFLILQSFLKGDNAEIKEVKALFVKDAVYHELRQILSNVAPIAAKLDTETQFSYVTNKKGDKVTLTKEQVLNSDDDKIITISTAYKFLKSGVESTLSDSKCFKAWQDNICTMASLAGMSLKDIQSMGLMDDEEVTQAIKEGKAYLESVQSEQEAIEIASRIVADFKAVFQASPSEAYKILQLLNAEVAKREAA